MSIEIYIALPSLDRFAANRKPYLFKRLLWCSGVSGDHITPIQIFEEFKTL